MYTRQHQRLVFMAMLTSQAVVISLLERYIPSPFTFAPGAKLGLANLMSIIALFTLPPKDSLKVISLRLMLTTLLGGTLSTFIYSCVGAFLSYFGMSAAKRLGSHNVSIVGISTLGGILHNIGQLSTAAFFAKTWAVLNYLPILALSGILSGFAVGLAGHYLLRHIHTLRFYHYQLHSNYQWLSH